MFLCTVHLVFSLKDTDWYTQQNLLEELFGSLVCHYRKYQLFSWQQRTEIWKFSPIYDTKMRNQGVLQKNLFLQSGFPFILSGYAIWRENLGTSSSYFFFFYTMPCPTDLGFPLGQKQCPKLGMDRKQCLLPCLCLLRIAYTKV